MPRPFFSVVLPTYNRAHFIAAAVKSVIGQTFNDWELIIIDDGSTDHTSQVVGSIADNRIKYVWQTNQERSAARNNGIALANGSFVCFLDSDDQWRPNHLETLHHVIEQNKGLDAFYFTAMRWNFENEVKDVIFPSPENKNAVEYVITYQIGVPTVAIPKAILVKEKFNRQLRINEDVELFARIVTKIPLIQIAQVTVDVFVHADNTAGLVKDVVTPQINATEIIFNNPQTGAKISSAFKKKRRKQLRHQLINTNYQLHKYAEMNREILFYLIKYPFEPGNKAKLVLLIYNLPGGSIIKALVQKLKGAH